MPVYEYLCPACGPFTDMRPMSAYAAPCDCPDCGTSAERAFFTVPAVLGMDSANRIAHATKEKSRHEPTKSASGKHAPGCGCCSGKSRAGVFRADGGKTFPSARPWMISH